MIYIVVPMVILVVILLVADKAFRVLISDVKWLAHHAVVSRELRRYKH